MNATAGGTLTVICIPTGAVSVLPVGNYAAGVGVPRPANPPVRPATCD
jgi:hypothetical protein